MGKQKAFLAVSLVLLLLGISAWQCGGGAERVEEPTEAPSASLSPVPSPTSTSRPLPTGTPIIYVVQQGDTLASIASRHKTTAEAICLLNELPDCSLIHPGQELLIAGEVVPPPVTPTPSATAATPETPVPTPTPKPPTPTSPPYKRCFGDLCLEETHSTTDEYRIQYIVGTIVNTGRWTYSYVQVEINLYDAQGNLVGSTLDNVNNLGPGGRWKFKAVILEKGVAKYTIMNITGF